MQRKNRSGIAGSFVLKDRSNQQLLDGAKHLVGRHRVVTAHLVAHLAEIDARDLHVVEGFPSLAKYCVGALGLSEDEGYRRAHAAVLAQKYPVILDMLLEGSIHLTTLRIIGQCLTKGNHRQVLEAACGKSKTELEHLAVTLCPKPDVPTVLRKLPEPKPEPESTQPGDNLFASKVPPAELPGSAPGMTIPVGAAQIAASGEGQPSATPIHAIQAGAEEIPLHVAPPSPTRSRMAPLSPERYNLQVTIDRETYEGLLQLQELLRHQVRNGDLARIIKDSVLERVERVKRGKFGKTKRARRTREQESWIQPEERVPAEDPAPQNVEPDESEHASGMQIGAPEFVNSRHIPLEVKREVWERDKGQCAFVGRSGRRCSEKARIEFHHIHAYALGGPATVENIALRCRTHNAYEGTVLFGKKFIRRGAKRDGVRPAANGDSAHPGTTGEAIRPGANAVLAPS